MNSKVIEGYKILSNFSINPTIPLLDGPLILPSPNCVDLSLFPSLSLTLSLYIPLYLTLLLYARINIHTSKCFQIRSISICHSLLSKAILRKKSSLSLYLLPFTSLKYSDIQIGYYLNAKQKLIHSRLFFNVLFVIF